ncbi:MAG TPA: YceI family protein [Streptosporangiaceae bacterium]|jgi:polyisoprenoid-binding protein YceI
MTSTRTRPAPALGRYQIEAGPAAVTFATRHLFGLGRVRGTLAVSSGTVDVAEPLAESGMEVSIDAASFRTGNAQRDGQVHSAAFLNTQQFPRLIFRAGAVADDEPSPGAVVRDAAGRLTVPGSLTVREVTRPVTLLTEFTDIGPRSFTARATTRIDRTEFGITGARGLAARYLGITVEVTCVRS